MIFYAVANWDYNETEITKQRHII